MPRTKTGTEIHAKTTKKPNGRPRGSILDNIPVQKRMLKRIEQTGRETRCFQDIVAESTYNRWKRGNEEWAKKINAAITHFHNNERLTSPDLEQTAIDNAYTKLHSGKASLTETLKFLEYQRKRRHEYT